MTIEELANQLQREFLGGQGKITQLPGAASPETRKFYSYHKGYDVGLPAGSPVTPSFAGTASNVGVVPGYGQRVLVTNPTTGQSYYLSHLSGVNFTGNNYAFKPGERIASTGGTPGKYGAGWSTGSHIDIEPTGAKQYQNLIYGNRSNNNSLAQLYSQMKSKYGNKLLAISRDPNKLSALNKSGKYKITKL